MSAFKNFTSDNEFREECEDPCGLTCPFCRANDGSCDHLLGWKDTLFSEGFVVDGGPLEELSGLYQHLHDAVTAYLSQLRGKKGWKSIKPSRLLGLIEVITKDTPIKGGR